MGKFIDANMLKEQGFVVAKVKKDKSGEVTEFITIEIDDVPPADAVSKCEYDAVVSAVDNSTKEFLKLHDAYQQVKQEVTRGIFNEIDCLIYAGAESYGMSKSKYDELREKRLAEGEYEELGEWIMSPDGIKPMTCSKCGMPALFEITKNQFADTEIVRVSSKFCPHCGKIMKNAEK